MNQKQTNQSGVRTRKGDSEDLTCSEGQVEDLLSKGESTEADDGEANASKKRAVKKPSPR